MQDMASQSAPQLDTDELRHTLSVHDVGAQLEAAGVPRSRRQIIRYCETAMLEAVKVPGPTGAQWFISPASVPKAIADLKQWDAQRVRHGTTKPDMSSTVELNPAPKIETDIASHGEPERAMSDEEIREKGSETERATARHDELNIYEHPYVKRLESQVEKWEGKYEAQVRRTEEIQIRHQEKLVELQRMTTIGQSKTLADFMLQAKNWIIGDQPEVTAPAEQAQ